MRHAARAPTASSTQRGAAGGCTPLTLDRHDVAALGRVQRAQARVDGAVHHLAPAARARAGRAKQRWGGQPLREHHRARAAAALAAAKLCACEALFCVVVG
jgi:hypothetical protein